MSISLGSVWYRKVSVLVYSFPVVKRGALLAAEALHVRSVPFFNTVLGNRTRLVLQVAAASPVTPSVYPQALIHVS